MKKNLKISKEDAIYYCLKAEDFKDAIEIDWKLIQLLSPFVIGTAILLFTLGFIFG